MTIAKINLNRLFLFLVSLSVLVIAQPQLVSAQSDENSATLSDQQPKLNHLAGEQSTYLLAHATDPVDWYPWGDEAFERAKAEDKPIFLSIGYAACHWCHVMQRETFEDVEMAGILNERFICVLVDREERPDLDHVYMGFQGVIAKMGGWPMTLFLTSDLKPFFAGGFFAPEPRYGRQGLKKLAVELARIYKRDRKQIESRSNLYFKQLAASLRVASGSLPLAEETVSREAGVIASGFDQIYGGFGQRAKFPRPVHLALLLMQFKHTGDSAYLNIVKKTLTAMSRGGIFDQLSGGFHRYTVDRRWRVPHFEKMLYDNALMVPVYCDVYRQSGDTSYLSIVVKTLDFILDELGDRWGGFYASIDSDSDGEEGNFYTWRQNEIVASDSLRKFIYELYDVNPEGEINGRNVLYLSETSDKVRDRYGKEQYAAMLSGAVESLMRVRASRSRPVTDMNVLVSWNGLALSALCNGYEVTADARYLKAARDNARLIRSRVGADNRLPHLINSDSSRQGLYLEDYAYYISGLLDLFQTDSSPGHFEWLDLARNLANNAIIIFGSDGGTLYLREKGQSDLVMRPFNEADGSVPAPGSIFIEDLLKLYRITGELTYRAAADKYLKGISGKMARSPSSMTSALATLNYYLSDKIEILLVGNSPERQGMIDEINSRFIPGRILIVTDDASEDLPLFELLQGTDSTITAYVCRNSVCALPVHTTVELATQLDKL